MNRAMEKRIDSIVLLPFPNAAEAKATVLKILSCPIGEKVIPFSPEYKSILRESDNLGLQCYYEIPQISRFFPGMFEDISTPLSLHFHYSRRTFHKLISSILEMPSEVRKNTTLFLDGCEWGDIIESSELNAYLNHFSKMVLTYDYRDGRIPKTYSAVYNKTISNTRRRPCRYPFESLSVDKRLNVYRCPFCCSRKLFQARDINEIQNDKRYLTFLASHLAGDLSLYPECRNCPYWLDGWLADETRFYNARNCTYRLLFQGHGCIISKEEDDK